MSWAERTSSLLDLEGAAEAAASIPPFDLAGQDRGGKHGTGETRAGGAAASLTTEQWPAGAVPSAYPPGRSMRIPDAAGGGRAAGAEGPRELAASPSLSAGAGGFGGAGLGLGLGLGLLRVPRSPSLAPSYGAGRSYNIRIGEEQQVLAKFTPRNTQPVYYLGDSVSGVLSFPPPSHSRMPLRRRWRCLEVSVQLETHESAGAEGAAPADALEHAGSAASLSSSFSSRSSSKPGLVPLHPTSSSSVTVRTEWHEMVLDLHSTSFLFTIPSDAPPGNAAGKTVQWVLHFEFVAFSLPAKEGKPSSARSAAPGDPGRDTSLGSIKEGDAECSPSEPMLGSNGAAASATDEEEDEEEEDLLQLLIEHQQQFPGAAGAGGPGRSKNRFQAEKAEWSMPITVQAHPLARRSSAA